MPTTSRLRNLWLAYFSRPASDRIIYRTILRSHPGRIVELGLGFGRRARRMIELAQQFQGEDPVRYAGIDLFESRPTGQTGLTLKDAHRLLKPTSARVQLVPGDPYAALVRTANSLTNTDLVIISADLDPDSLSRAWFYLPRMLGPQAQVFLEIYDASKHRSMFQLLSRSEVDTRAAAHSRRRAA